MTYKFEIQNNNYCLIFSDGLVLEEPINDPNAIDYQAERPMVLTNFKRPDDRWTYYALFSNGEIEKYSVGCHCRLPKEVPGMSPLDYEMYVLLFQNWVKKGKLTYSKENRDTLEEVVKQFDNKGKWLDDIIRHKFTCNECSDELIFSINTYRGGGGLERNEKLAAIEKKAAVSLHEHNKYLKELGLDLIRTVKKRMCKHINCVKK